jgi:hypothetical protein
MPSTRALAAVNSWSVSAPDSCRRDSRSSSAMVSGADDQMVAEGEIRTVLGHFSLCGEGLCIGYDGGDQVSTTYPHRFEFTGGEIVKVVSDVEAHLAAAMARD